MLEEQDNHASKNHFSPVSYAQWDILQKLVHLLVVIWGVDIASPIWETREN